MDDWTREGKKKLYFRCPTPECGKEWTRWQETGDMRRSSFCGDCKLVVTYYKTEKTQTTQAEVKSRKLKPLW
jgi:hypothetical protein